jgi:LysR family hydrogen peroxide-inducible transcriptional activator
MNLPRHFGKAAEQCFVTQSTLSAGIQDLEIILGTKLVERTNRKVIPTSIGIDIASRAKSILSLSSDLVDIAKSENTPLAGKVKVGVIPSISPFLLPRALPLIRKELPQLQVVLVEDQSERLVNLLRSGELDIAVLAFPYDTSGLNHQIFSEEQFWLAMPKSHSLASTETIRTRQLPADELLLLSEGHCLREHALSACQLPNSSQRTSMQGTSLYTLIEMVASGLGVTLIPAMAINSDMVKHADITLRPLEKSTRPMRELGLVWRPSYSRTELLNKLSSLLTQTLE